MTYILRAFCNDYEISRKIIIDARTGVDPEPPRKKYASYSERLLRIVSKYGRDVYEGDTMMYLKDIANLL